MRVESFFVHFATTGPAPVLMTPWAFHVSAALAFLCLCFAAWTCSNISSQPWPYSKTARSLVMTSTFMPRFSTPETHWLPTSTHRLVLAAAWLFYYVFTLRACTPLDAWILTHFYILLDMMKKLNVFLFAENSYLLLCEELVAVPLHTGYFQYFALLDAGCQILFDTVDTRLMSTLESIIVVRNRFIANRT